MKIAIGTDHGGYHLKAGLIHQIKSAGYQVIDEGTFSSGPCDYPEIGARVAKAVSSGKVQRGLLLCKSGAGMAIVANKFPRVRAAVCHTAALAKHTREHNDSNVLVIAAAHASSSKAKAIVLVWLKTPFGGGRHGRRIRQIERIEREILCRRNIPPC